MPLQNRVTPEGVVVAAPERGLIYGNRGGCFHRPDGTLKARQWANRQWICCVLEFKNRRRALLQPDRFTELFFLDEATAFAAGHRPCFECRRADAVRFQRLWGGGVGDGQRVAAPDMDVALHAERLTVDGLKRVVRMPLAELSDGAMVRWQGGAYLVVGQRLRRWSFGGYGTAVARPQLVDVEVLTPPRIVAILQSGYRPILHPSATEGATETLGTLKI
jgi:hypothetical protein